MVYIIHKGKGRKNKYYVPWNDIFAFILYRTKLYRRYLMVVITQYTLFGFWGKEEPIITFSKKHLSILPK